MMKLISTILALTISLSAFSQTFILQSNTSLPDLNICQENHNRILTTFLSQTDSQITRLVTGISIEENLNTKPEKIASYKDLLSKLLVKRIFLKEISKQLNAQKFSTFFSNKDNYKKDILKPESIKLDLETQFDQTLRLVVKKSNLQIAEEYLKDLLKDILKKSLSLLAKKEFRSIGAGLFVQLLTDSGGKIISTTVLKSVSASFASQLFISVGTSLIIDLVTIPLHAHRLPAENLWADLLKQHPEIIIVPEWMKRGGIDDQPWTVTHCNAIQRQTKTMEKLFKRSVAIDEDNFISSVTQINLAEDVTTEEGYVVDNFPAYVTPVDNTFVKKPFINELLLAPAWAIKYN